MGGSLILLCFLVLCKDVCSYDTFTISMPNVPVPQGELYMCTSIKLDEMFHEPTFSIVGFEPLVTPDTAHHVLLFGCSSPASEDPSWICGNMGNLNATNPFHNSCSEDLRVLYSWAEGAAPLMLPENVGYRVSQESKIQYIVLQVHYHLKDSARVGQPDSSGMKIRYVNELLPLQAGVLTLFPVGTVFAPAHSTSNSDMICDLEETKSIMPIAFRTHTHSLGRMVSGWLVRRDSSGKDEWTRIGRQDPLHSQAFVPVENSVTVKPGDLLAVRCLMQSDRNTDTTFGFTASDEMCAFFIIYYVDNGLEPLVNTFCTSQGGKPNLAWNLMGLNNIPKN